MPRRKGAMRRKLNIRNTTGYRGISRYTAGKCYLVTLCCDGERHYIGYAKTIRAARKMQCAFRKALKLCV